MRVRTWTTEQDDLILKYYGATRTARHKLLKLPEFENVPDCAITKRANMLGVSRSRAVSLDDSEKKMIADYAGNRSIPEIQRSIKALNGRKRDYDTISNFIRRTLKQSVRPDRYSLQDLKVGFRCSTNKILKWVKEEKLKGYRDKVACGSEWRFRPIHVAQFIIHHPFELEHIAVDVPWVVSLIIEFASEVRQLTRRKKD
jgi:hypothetical protein